MRTCYFGVFYFCYFTTIGVFMPFWGLFLQHKGFSPTEIGQLIAILTLTKVFAPNIWAAIADDIATKRGSSLGIIKYAALAALVIYCLLGLVGGFWPTALIMFGFCIFWNANLPQLEAATLKHLQDRTDQYGAVRLWGSVSFILVVLSMGWVLDPAALASVFLASLLMRDGSRETHVSPIKVAQNKTLPLIKLINRKVVLILSLGMFMQFSHAPWQAFFSIYLESYGYSKSSIGMLWSLGVVFEIIVFLFAYKLLYRFSLAHILSFTLLIAGIRWCLVSAFPESMTLISITQAMHAITYGLYHSVMMQLIDRLFQGQYQVRGQALYGSVIYGVGGTLGSVASGYLWSFYGKNAMFMGAGIMMFVAFLVSVVFIKHLSIDERSKVNKITKSSL